MRRLITLSITMGFALAVMAAGPASAGSRQAVSMTVITTFDENLDAFTATGIPDCDSGLVYEAGANFAFTPSPPTGVFAGFKVFECEGGENGFLVRLNARFDSEGAVGTWAVLDSWGSLAGMTGTGSLDGERIQNGIIDTYVGTLLV